MSNHMRIEGLRTETHHWEIQRKSDLHPNYRFPWLFHCKWTNLYCRQLQEYNRDWRAVMHNISFLRHKPSFLTQLTIVVVLPRVTKPKAVSAMSLYIVNVAFQGDGRNWTISEGSGAVLLNDIKTIDSDGGDFVSGFPMAMGNCTSDIPFSCWRFGMSLLLPFQQKSQSNFVAILVSCATCDDDFHHGSKRIEDSKALPSLVVICHLDTRSGAKDISWWLDGKECWSLLIKAEQCNPEITLLMLFVHFICFSSDIRPSSYQKSSSSSVTQDLPIVSLELIS